MTVDVKCTKMDLRISLTLLIFTTFGFITDVHPDTNQAIISTDGRRTGGGGTRRGGGGTHGGSVRSGSVRSNYHGPRYSGGSWKTAAAVGTLYGIRSYKQRRLYIDNPDREPTICFNEEELRNDTFGYFICPEDTQEDALNKCCGDDNSQYCCEGLSGAIIGGIVGGIMGALILIGIIIGVVLVLKNRGMRPKRRAIPAQSWARNQTPAVQYTAPNSPGTEPTGLSNVYSTQYSGFQEQTDGQKAQIGFEGSMSVPSSDPPPYSEHGKF